MSRHRRQDRGLIANESLAGKRGACPGCKQVLVVPAAGSLAQPAEPVQSAFSAPIPANGLARANARNGRSGSLNSFGLSLTRTLPSGR